MVRDSHRRLHELKRSQELWRTDSQVDKDRVFYSREFRRLSGVTQVVPPQTGFLFHDRLTHSLKVAQVAETLARRLIFKHRTGTLPTGNIRSWINPNHCYVAGLAHDIGHPPFGHAGEQQLQQVFERLPDLWYQHNSPIGKPPGDELRVTREGLRALAARSFEGNAQSTRIVASLSVRKTDPGLNLTLRSMAAIAKYPWLEGQHPAGVKKLKSKWSFYPEEKTILEELEKERFVKSVRSGDGKVSAVRRWIEAEIMDWADDITYAVHDVEDFFRAGMLPLHRVRVGLRELPENTDWMTSAFDDVKDDEIRSCFVYVAEKLSRSIAFDGTSLTASLPAMWVKLRQLLAAFPSGPFSGTHDSNVQVHRFASVLIRYLSMVTSAVYHSGSKRLQLQIEPEGVLFAEFFKALNDFFVIRTGALTAMQEGQSNSLEQVFHVYCKMSRDLLARISKEEETRVRTVPISRQVDLYREVPAALREYILDNTKPASIAELKASGGGVVINDTAAKEFAIAISVVDFMCGLRDSQLALLASQLGGSREPGSMPVGWLDS